MTDIGAVLRAARTAAGVSLAAMAARTNYSKPYLGQLETGQRTVRPEHVKAYEEALDVDIDRLASVALAPRRVDAASLTDLATILSATRRLEDAAGATAVLPAVRGFSMLAQSLAQEARSALEGQSTGLASEVSQYRGWLEHATGDTNAADRCFDQAISLATQSNDPDRLVHGLSFKGYAALENRSTGDAAALTDQALQVSGAHPLLRVYDHYQRARIQATSRERRVAQQTLLLADKVAEAASDLEPPDSGYWYTDGLWGLHRGRVLWLLGQRTEAKREVEQGLAAMPEEHQQAEWATQWVRTVLSDGDVQAN